MKRSDSSQAFAYIADEAGMRDDPADRLLAGDRRTVEEIRAAVSAVVRRFRVPASTSREDLIQEALCRVCLAISDGRFERRSSLRTYAQNAAKYTCIEYLRRERLAQALDPEQADTAGRFLSPEQSVLRGEARSESLRALATMSESCRTIFYLIFVERRSYSEAAALLGISEGTLRVRIHRCRSKANEALDAIQKGPRKILRSGERNLRS